MTLESTPPGRLSARLSAWLSPGELKARLGGLANPGAGELALLDVREHGQYGEGHPFLAVSLPYSRLELDAPALLPSRATPLVLLDQDDGVAERAARRLAGLGYRDIAILEGGAPGWAAAGFTLFKGVHVPSKTFGELVEEELHTPSLTAEALLRMRSGDAAPLQFDGRPLEEYRNMTIPGARCCPNAELAHRLPAMLDDPGRPIVVNCAGRTRSIVGTQSLILAGVPNPVYALENGTQGWALAGLELETGAERSYPATLDPAVLEASRRGGRRLIEDHGLRLIDEAGLAAWAGEESRSLYCLDVRTPEEFAACRHRLARSAPGGQLVQATDRWIAVRNARVVLIDDTGLRAALTALWLRAMGHEVAILDLAHAPAAHAPASASAPPPPLPTSQAPPSPPAISPAEAKSLLEGDAARLLDLRPSADFRRRRIAGARWSIRPRLPCAGLKRDCPLVLTAATPEIAALAALDLREAGHDDIRYLAADEAAWADAGLDLRPGDELAEPDLAEPDLADPDQAEPDLAEDEAIDFLFFVHDRHSGNREAMRGYLAWETGLVGQLDAQERAVFDLEPLRRAPAG